MSGATTALAVVGGMVLASTMNKQPSFQAPPAPQAPPASQASQAPDVQGVRAGQSGQGQAGGAPGVAQTFLTGGGGVDPNQLKLDKTTLLGG